ncbi:metallophosphoesterase [Clostridium sporogenes]|nr:metallophosphoesterase [Clostridium sporogenes]NFI73043.1 metallophosphoesterase [Clostridium sporogenes]UAL59902.1 metallophosphoesterase [Clostridium sporogenes]
MKGRNKMSTFRILHLSDIYIGKMYKPSEDSAYKIISYIDQNVLCSFRSVIVTGDIFKEAQLRFPKNLRGM